MNSFNNANNFIVHNLNQTEYRTSDGFKVLQDHVVKGAAHNSGERFDAPKCHPDTRKAVLKSIKSWVDSNDTERIMWLHGPAGAGKSAIAQTTALDCDKEGKLAASFFFFRLAGRDRKNGLIATISYQLCVSIPAIKEHIIKYIETNPKIFEADIKTQLQWLVIKPLSLVHYYSSTRAKPRLIIIDGLDECEIRKDQAEIIESFSTSLSSVDSSSSLRVLLVSRPELEIRRAFNKENISSLCTRIILDDSFDPDKDIELYLRSHFQTIRHEHTLGSVLPQLWPSDDSVKKLVAKSSGQFVYASTVIHFVSDPEHDPRKRLDTILQIRTAEADDKPYRQLDALYSAILSMCKDYAKVIAIFEVVMLAGNKPILKSVNKLEIFLSLKDEIMLLLANLHSIVDVNNIARYGIRFYHASMFDYLVESSRSLEFYIDKREGHVHLSMKCLQFLSNPLSMEIPVDTIFKFCIDECFTHYMDSGWDERVFDYINEMRILKPDGNQMEWKNRISSIKYTPDTYISMLSRLIEYVNHGSIGTAGNTRIIDIIEAEILNHLENYPRKDIIYILLNEITDAQCIGLHSPLSPTYKIAYTLHKNFTTTEMPGYMNIMRAEIFVNPKVQEWFIDAMNHKGYIHKISDDVHAQAICSILDLKLNNPDITIPEYLIQRIFDHLPLSKKISYELSEKQKDFVNDIMPKKCSVSDSFKSEIEGYIQSYCKRVENAHRLKGILSAWKRKMVRAR